MKRNLLILIVFVFFIGVNQLSAQQEDATTPVSSTPAGTDTISDNPPAKKQKKEKKKRDDIKISGGISFNKLNTDSDLLKPTTAIGWNLGVSYKRGRFFYWELGAVFDKAVYNLKDTTMVGGGIFDGVFSVSSIEIPISGGINFLSPIGRLVGLRVFIGVTPGFKIAVGDNNPDVSTDIVSSFNINGNAGVGVDVAFIFVEAGFKYGFLDLLDDINSNPNQIYIKLGFRF